MSFPPTVLLHGDGDELVEVEKSDAVAATFRSLGVDLDKNDEGLGGKTVTPDMTEQIDRHAHIILSRRVI